MPSKRKERKKRDAVWLFAGGPMQELMAKAVKARGFELIVTDMNPKCLCAGYANRIIPLDTFDITGNIAAASVLRREYNIRAVVTAGADCHETVATVAKFLKVHGLDPKISHACRYKEVSRKILTEAGIPQPRYRTVATLADARIAAQEIGFPCALKATNNSGSRGFSKINRLNDLNEEAFQSAVSSGTTGKVIIEELLVPVTREIAEQSVETVWYNGEMYWLNWVDRLFRKDVELFPRVSKVFKKQKYWGIEIAHINPALHSLETKDAVYEMLYRAGVALGFHKTRGGHILKADIMLTKKGPYIMEVTPRLSGGWDSAKTTPLRGADFIGGALSFALGEELTVERFVRYFVYKNPSLFASVFSLPNKERTDCIGRRFSCGASFSREESLFLAHQNLSRKKYLPG